MWDFIKRVVWQWAHDTGLNPADLGFGSITVAAIFEMLPHATAALSFIWIVVRLYITIRDEWFKKKE